MLSAYKELTNATCKEGHIVKVKNLHNAPFMHVRTLYPYYATCGWFDDRHVYHSQEFKFEQLAFVQNELLNPDIVIPETRGIYAACKLTGESEYQLTKWMARHGIPNPVTRDSFHITTVYSRKPFEYTPKGRLHDVEGAWCSGYDMFDNGQALVMKVSSAFLEERFKAAMAAGATYDYPSYIPHLTLSYAAAGFDFSKLPKYEHKLWIEREYSEFLEPQIDLTKEV